MSRNHLSAVNNQPAYRVPWVFERGNTRYTLRNVGREPLRAVTFTLYGGGVMPVSAPARLAAGDALEIRISGRDLARDTIGIVRWFRPDGDEYLWRVSF